MEEDAERLARLFDSVEREERILNIPRSTGPFIRELFPDEHITNRAVESDYENEGVQELPIEEEEVASDSEDEDQDELDLLGQQQEFEDNEIQGGNVDEDDFEDIECIPLNQRKSSHIVNRRNGEAAYMSKSRTMLWNLHPRQNVQIRTQNRNILRMRMGCVVQGAKNVKSPFEAWALFFNDDTLDKITNYTNIYINKNKEKFSRDRDCKITNPDELRAVLGLIYMAGVMHSNHHKLEDLWATDGTGIEFFRCVMSLSRFKFLLRCMRFDDITTRQERKSVDKLAPIREVFDDFVEMCQKHYVVSEYVTVDEMLESFRGRCSFRQYIKNKPARYGVKVYAMVCAKTFYTANLEIYAGAQPEGPYVTNNASKEVVLRMIEPISGSGRNVTVDNFFTSIPLCEELLKDHRLTLVGTLRKNKREVPCAFIDTKDRSVGSSSFGFSKNCTIVSYKAKKNKDVLLLSSMHDSDSVDMTEDSRSYQKPEIILFYNSSKGGVDTVDKYKQSYSTARITNRWSMRLFYTILDIGGLNSYIILKKNLNLNMLRRQFIKELAFGLCKDYGNQRLAFRNVPKLMKLRICDILGIQQQQLLRQDPPPNEITSGRCYICTWKKNRPSKTRCNHCQFFICREHSAVTCRNCLEGRDGEEEMDVDSE